MQVAAFMDAVEPCLYSVYTATVLAAIDALLCWARATSNEYWRAPTRACAARSQACILAMVPQGIAVVATGPE